MGAYKSGGGIVRAYTRGENISEIARENHGYLPGHWAVNACRSKRALEVPSHDCDVSARQEVQHLIQLGPQLTSGFHGSRTIGVASGCWYTFSRSMDPIRHLTCVRRPGILMEYEMSSKLQILSGTKVNRPQ